LHWKDEKEVTGSWKNFHKRLPNLNSVPNADKIEEKIGWACSMYEMRNTYRVLAGELEGKGPGTPRRKWDNTKLGHTPARVKTCNSQDTMSAT
jgi:hypothetical protein